MRLGDVANAKCDNIISNSKKESSTLVFPLEIVSTMLYDSEGKRVSYSASGSDSKVVSPYYSLVNGGILIHPTPSSQIINNGLHYILTDHLNSRVLSLSSLGSVIEQIEYTPYGDLIKYGDDFVKRSFLDREYDTEISLSYLNARYFNKIRRRRNTKNQRIRC